MGVGRGDKKIKKHPHVVVPNAQLERIKRSKAKKGTYCTDFLFQGRTIWVGTALKSAKAGVSLSRTVRLGKIEEENHFWGRMSGKVDDTFPTGRGSSAVPSRKQ